MSHFHTRFLCLQLRYRAVIKILLTCSISEASYDVERRAVHSRTMLLFIVPVWLVKTLFCAHLYGDFSTKVKQNWKMWASSWAL